MNTFMHTYMPIILIFTKMNQGKCVVKVLKTSKAEYGF